MWPYPRIIAHRGGGILAPENTLAAMRYAKAHGFHGVEFDVMLSQDGIPVLMHDPAFGRTIAGAGQVHLHSAARLGTMDAGSWHSPAFAGEPVPSLVRVAGFCRAGGLWMNIEIKPVPGFEIATGAAVAFCTRTLFADLLDIDASAQSTASLPLLSSFSVHALLAAKRVAPALPVALLVDQVPAAWRQQCAEVSAISLHVNHRHLTPALAGAVKAAGLGLFCYTVNEPDRGRLLLSWGVDGFCTDRLDVIGPDFPAMA